jgi:erythritol kinase
VTAVGSTSPTPSPSRSGTAICVDAGTTVIKAVVFGADGRERAVARRPTLVQHGAGGRAEQDPDEVWDAVVAAVREVRRAVPEPVDFVALTGQGDGCWLVDRDDRPVRPAVLWNDGRAGSVVERWRLEGRLDEAFVINGSLTFAGLANAVLRHLVDEEPDAVERADSVLTCSGWLFLRLTGQRAVDGSEAAAPWLDIASMTYSSRLLELYEIPEVERLLPELRTDDRRVEPLWPSAAAELGLPAGTPVVLAPYDVAATAIGAGAICPGSAVSVLGTTLATEVVLLEPDTSGRPSGLTVGLGVGEHRLRAFPTLAGCGVIDWLVELLGLAGPAEVSELAAQAPLGAGGLQLLPYLSPAGERAPFLAPAASGALTGLTFGHGRAHTARAVLEGLAHVIADCLAAAPVRPTELRLCGGGAASGFWCRVIADVTGVRAVRSADHEVGAKGAFLIGLAAVGAVRDVPSAAQELVRELDSFEPDPEAHAAHVDGLEEFFATRNDIAPSWPRRRALADAQAAAGRRA